MYIAVQNHIFIFGPWGTMSNSVHRRPRIFQRSDWFSNVQNMGPSWGSDTGQFNMIPIKYAVWDEYNILKELAPSSLYRHICLHKWIKEWATKKIWDLRGNYDDNSSGKLLTINENIKWLEIYHILGSTFRLILPLLYQLEIYNNSIGILVH